MHYAIIFVLLLGFVAGLGLLARRLATPYPILFVLGGLLISFVIDFFPALPRLKLDPDFIFFIFLPPLLYIQAFNTSWRDFRRDLGPISLLAIGLVLVTTVAVAYVAHALIPNFSLAAGFVLGAIISPPDAIAASAIAQRLGLPRRVVTILEGESLVNDSTSLVAFKLALASLGLEGISVIGSAPIPAQFILVSGGGVAVGLLVGWVVATVRRYAVNDGPQIMLTISLLTPFASYLAAEPLGVSSVLSVVTTGLYLGWGSPEITTSAVRLQAQAVWDIIIYLLNGFVFVLIGLQLPGILNTMREGSWRELLAYALAVNATCIGVRVAWVFSSAYLPHLLRLRAWAAAPDWRQILIISWSGMRGVVSLAAALTLEGYPDFPHGNLVQFLAFSVILTTLVFQGLTLPPLIRFLRVGVDGAAAKEEREARRRISEMALEKITELQREEKFPNAAITSVEKLYRDRAANLDDQLLGELGWSDQRHHMLSLRRLRRLMVASERRTLIDLRRNGVIGDDVLHKIEHELDLEEARFKI